ncbi:TonB-dependent receptor [Pedobacter sp. L105]|uniref:TonB-dependent receptor n=1 Tax=Pedobacter sp. L105 TaxID=1641871 RepID=UPI00131E708C|nr:TonB-dependent receptor [Pedobacter sp. L105]
MKKPLYLILILITIFTVCTDAQTISGTIKSDAQPLSGASVRIEGKKLETSSDQDGHFQLQLAPGTYNLLVSYIGYTQQVQKVNLSKGQNLKLDLMLKPGNYMDEVVVVSSRKPTKISEVPGTIWIVDNQRLQEQIRAGVSLKEALAQLIPGLDAGPEGRTNYGQNLRGRNVLVMIDGVSLNSTRNVSRQFDAIDPFNIERIEVLSGASAVYGGGATGGIINIITKKGQSGPTAFTTEAGARSGLKQKNDLDIRIDQAISGGNENFTGRLGIAYQKNNAAYGADNKQIFTDITQTDLQYNQSFDIFANTEFKLTTKQTLKVNAQYYNSGYVGNRDLFLGTNLAGLLSNPSLLEMRNGFVSSVTPQTSRASINADYHAADILGGQDLYVQGSSRNEKFSFHPFPAQVRNASVPGGGILYGGSSTQRTQYNALKAALTKQWSAFNITYGVDADNEGFNAQQTLFDRTATATSGGLINNGIATTGRYPGYTVNSLSGFAQAQWNLTEKLSLSGGVRQQRLNVSVDDFAGADVQALIAYGLGQTATPIPGGKNHYDVNLLNGGLVYKLSAPEQVWLNYSQGFSLADPAKYYGQGTYQLVGTNWNLLNGTSVSTSPLTGIKTDQLEAGWRHRSKIINAQLAAFYSWSDKNLAIVPITLAVNVIDQKQRNLGVEGSLQVNLPDGFEVGGNGLYIKTQNKVDDSWKLQTVTTASPSKATAFLGWRNQSVGFKVQGFRSFDLTDALDSKLKGYTTLDILGNVKLPLGTLSFGVQNLLNKEYQTIWSQRSQLLYKGLATPATFYYAGRGRTYNLSYTINY